MDLVAELEAARERVRNKFHGIGVPIIRIPITAIGVYKDATDQYATISYDDLIALVKRAIQ